jgi:hypothetical protein
MLGEIECLYSRIVDRCPAMPTSAPGPGRVETPFIRQKLQRMGVVHVDVTV